MANGDLQTFQFDPGFFDQFNRTGAFAPQSSGPSGAEVLGRASLFGAGMGGIIPGADLFGLGLLGDIDLKGGFDAVKDPAGFFSGQMDIGGAIDPGSKIIGGFFGDKAGKLARKIADPFGLIPDAPAPVRFAPTQEQFVRAVSPQALKALQGGTQRAIDLTALGLGQAAGQLAPFAGSEAFREQAALLGGLGSQEQQAAIQGIPISDATLQSEGRQREGLLRRAAALGRARGGATIDELVQLGGGQQAQRVTDRLQQLQGLSDIGRTTASTISGLGEAATTRQAQLLAGLGGQEAATLLGQAGPIAQSRSVAAELAGLRDIGRANQTASLLATGGQLLGRFFPQGGSTQGISTGSNPFVSSPNPLGLTPGQGL